MKANKYYITILAILFCGTLKAQLNVESSRALIKRTLPQHASLFIIEPFKANDKDVFEIESRNNKIVVRGNTVLNLRRREFDLLEFMVRNTNKTLRRETLLHHVWPDDSNAYSNLVDAHIKSLRDRVDRPFEKKLIKTVYGIGYRLEI